MMKNRLTKIQMVRYAVDAVAGLLVLLAVLQCINSHFRVSSILSSAVLLGCTAVLLIIRQYLIEPLIRLQRYVTHAAEPGEDNRQSAENELEYLTTDGGEVGALIAQVAKNVHDGSKARALNTEVALYALQSEINPHFLYNSLDTIRNYAMNYGVHEVADMALALARIFRYSISRPGETATLIDEVNNVRNYLKIQNYRFPNKFELEIEMDEADKELMSCTMPVLTLQPIVENAFHHGVEKLTRSGKIKISVLPTDQNLVITVADNGIGIPADKLNELRDKLDSGFVPQSTTPGRQLHHKTGVSLNNVNNRLKIYFGNEYGMSITSLEGTFTKVEIVIPKVMNQQTGK